MAAYLEVTTAFAILSGYAFLLFRLWHRQLVALAARHDLAGRRKHASRQALIITLLFVVPAIAIVGSSLAHNTVNGVYIACVFILSLAPGVAWYAWRIPSLRALGYYGGQR